MRRLLLALILAAGAHLSLAAPALACSCASPGQQEYFERAGVVFAGELVAYNPPPGPPLGTSAEPAIWTFNIASVYKGDAGAIQDVASPVSGASCGLEIPHSGTFLVFAHTDPGGEPFKTVGGQALYAGLCGGTRALDDEPVPAAFGEKRPPTPGVRSADVPKSPSSSASPSVVAARPTDNPRPGSGVDWATVAAWSTGGAAALVAASLVPIGRRRRRGRAGA